MPIRAACRAGLLAVSVSLSASTSAGSTTNSLWFVRPWQSDENLPNNTVHALAQTPDGYLWLGTPSGLARFDGIRFEDFSPTNFVAPPNRGVIAMLLGHKGFLWLGMDRGGIVSLEGNASRAYTALLPSSIPNDMAEDAEGTLWVSYRGGAVYRIKDGQVSTCAAEAGLPESSDNCALCCDSQGRLWFAKAGQCGIFRDGAFRMLQRYNGQPARLTSAQAGGVWLCAGRRLFQADDAGQFKDCGEFKPEHGNTTVSALLEDHEGAVWIGTSYSGLFRYDESGFESVQTSHQEILGLAEDSEGSLWVGTQGGGLDRLRRRAIALEDVESGLPFASVQSICEDAAGNVWVAAQNGALARRIGGRWTTLSADEHWSANATCVAADKSGAVWIGTQHHGLFCWRGERFVTWGDLGELAGRTLHTLLVSREGDLWLGTENPNSIQRLRQGQITSFEVPQDSRIIRAMAEDATGSIWAGTSKGVLYRIADGRLSEVKLRPSPEIASIRCLASTPDGALWIGYAGWGLGRLKDGHYTEIHSEKGLFDDYISHIECDGHGWLWFGANRGIFKVRLQELEAVAENRLSRVRSIHYGRSEGLPSMQSTFGDSPDSLRSRDGRIWLPMRTALVVVDPEKLGDSSHAPPVLLERVTVDDRPAAWYGGVLPLANRFAQEVVDLDSHDATLRLGPAYRRLEFEFTAPTFAAPENIQFRYRLEGTRYDENWVDAGTHRTAPYPRLTPGKYTFKVAACGSDGEWIESAKSLRLVVAPFFYQTWWFRTGVVALFTLAVAAVVRYVSFRRLHRQLRLLEAQASLHKERARIAKDIHDDLGANLTQIALLGELARQDQGEPDKAAARMEKISGTARQAIKALDEIVWAVNPRNDTLAHLIDYAGQFAFDHLRLAGIRCRLDFPEQAPARELSTEVRHNLFLAVKEALNNVVRHAHATEVWFRAKVAGQGLELRIEDNGCGFGQAPEDALADGLRNMRQRMADIGGECRIQSRPGAGTVVVFLLPWANK